MRKIRLETALWFFTPIFLFRLAEPFISNQNLYLLHAASNLLPSMGDDWLVSTTDTNPFFTLISKFLLSASGTNAVKYINLMFWLLCLISFRIFLKDTTKDVLVLRTTLIILAGLQLIGLTLSGFGGQYTFTSVAYWQPASAGSAMIFATIMAMRRNFLAAYISWCLAISIHPSLIISSSVLFWILLLSGLIFRESLRKELLLKAVMLQIIAFLPVYILNPKIFNNLNLSNKISLERFAFERIPHHTLFTHWPRSDIFVVLIWIYAIYLCYKTPVYRKYFRFFLITLVFCITSAFFVFYSKNVFLALAMPWRLSVIIAPLSLALVVVHIVTLLYSFFGEYKIMVGHIFLVISCGLSVYVFSQSINSINEYRASELAIKLNSLNLSGVGFIPIDMGEVRLNSALPIFVDWKSQPYLGSDLDEWWSRIDYSRRANEHPDLLCEFLVNKKINWFIFDDDRKVPKCISSNLIRINVNKFTIFTN